MQTQLIPAWTLRVLWLLLLVAAGSRARAQRAVGADTVRGYVVDTLGLPISEALVSATSTSGLVRRARSNEFGRFQIVLPSDTGRVLVDVKALGMQPLEVWSLRSSQRTFQLKPVSTTLALLSVVVPRRKPPQPEGVFVADVAASEYMVGFGAVSVDQQGSVGAMASAVPGVEKITTEETGSASFSVLGMSPERNLITLNDFRLHWTDIPQDAAITGKLTASTYDPSRGGFSGALYAIRTIPGANLASRSLHLTTVAPPTAGGRSKFAPMGPNATRSLRIGGNSSGAIWPDRLHYSASFELTLRRSEVESLGSASDLQLAAQNILPSEVRDISRQLSDLGINSANRSRLESAAMTLLARGDYLSDSKRIVTTHVGIRHVVSSPLPDLPRMFPSQDGHTTSNGLIYQLQTSKLSPSNVRQETRLGLSSDVNSSDGGIALSTGRVLLASAVGPSGSRALVVFGGNSIGPRTSRSTDLELQHSVRWLSEDSRHEYKLVGSARFEEFHVSNAPNSEGTFYYASPYALRLNDPFLYQRSLRSLRSAAEAATVAVSMSDAFRVTPVLQIQFGMRLDASKLDASGIAPLWVTFGHPPKAPSVSLSASPRVGVSFTPRGKRFDLGGLGVSPRYVVRFGVGRFQETVSASTTATYLAQSADRSILMCIGDAVPTAPWHGHQTPDAPSECAKGSGVQSVGALIDPSARSPYSWRGAASWFGRIIGGYSLGAEYISSWEYALPSFADLNLPDAPMSSLHGEGDRKVFFDSPSVESLGDFHLAPSERKNTDFQSILAKSALGKTYTSQLSLSLSSPRPSRGPTWGLVYTFRRGKERSNGYLAGSSGDSFKQAWTQGARGARHQFSASGAIAFAHAVHLILVARVTSGLPFTPLVGSDVNGDGRTNDLPFVVGLDASAADTVQREGLRKLLGNSSHPIKTCLLRQADRFAERGSCLGVPTTAIFAQLGLNSEKVGLPSRLYVSVGLSNIQDGLAHIFGTGAPWLGTDTRVDPVLLRVVGFDTSQQRYRYLVNQQFGKPPTGAPSDGSRMRATLEARWAFGHGASAEALALIVGRSAKKLLPTIADLKLRYRQHVLNPAMVVLLGSDSLKLSSKQVGDLAILSANFEAGIDSAVAPFAVAISRGKIGTNSRATSRLLEAVNGVSYQILAACAVRIRALLSSAQSDSLPPWLALLLDPRTTHLFKPSTDVGFGAALFRQ